MHDTLLSTRPASRTSRRTWKHSNTISLLRGYFKTRGYEDASEVTKNEITKLPSDAPIKEFTYSVKMLFDKKESAKLSQPKPLHDSGEFLTSEQFAGWPAESRSPPATRVTRRRRPNSQKPGRWLCAIIWWNTLGLTTAW